MLSATGVGTDSGTVTEKRDHIGVLNTFVWISISLLVATALVIITWEYFPRTRKP